MNASVQEQSELQTYDLIMARNILNNLGLAIGSEEVMDALLNPSNQKFMILKLPMQSAMNSMIISQIESYKIFCQKRLVDYIVLTNPNQDTQSKADFEDNVPDSIAGEKTRLLALQSRTRDVLQEHYDLIASIWSFLRKVIKKTEFKKNKLNLAQDQSFISNFQDYEANIIKIKLILINLRSEFEELSRSILQIMSERSEFFLDNQADQDEKTDLSFYRRLGIDKE